MILNGKSQNPKKKCNILNNFIYYLINLIELEKKNRVNVTYVLKDGTSVKVSGKVGDNVMYLAHRHNIPLEGLFKILKF